MVDGSFICLVIYISITAIAKADKNHEPGNV